MCSENRNRTNGMGNGLSAPEWRIAGLTAYDNGGKLQLAGEHARSFARALDVSSDHPRRVTFSRSRHLGGGRWQIVSNGGCGGSRIVANIQVKRGGVVVSDVEADDIAGQLDELQKALAKRSFGTHTFEINHRKGNVRTSIEVDTDDPEEITAALGIVAEAVAPDTDDNQSGEPDMPEHLKVLMAMLA